MECRNIVRKLGCYDADWENWLRIGTYGADWENWLRIGTYGADRENWLRIGFMVLIGKTGSG